MNEKEFRRRTMGLGLEVVRLCDRLQSTRSTEIISRQLIRCATSVGANYRAACHARSKADMVAKLGIVEEEADETIYWLQMLALAELAPREDLAALAEEAKQILAMTISSKRTLRTRINEVRTGPTNRKLEIGNWK